MIQIAISISAIFCIWYGIQGFRTKGLKFGIASKPEHPLPPKQGKIVGSLLISFGLLLLVFAFIIFPVIVASF